MHLFSFSADPEEPLACQPASSSRRVQMRLSPAPPARRQRCPHPPERKAGAATSTSYTFPLGLVTFFEESRSGSPRFSAMGPFKGREDMLGTSVEIISRATACTDSESVGFDAGDNFAAPGAPPAGVT